MKKTLFIIIFIVVLILYFNLKQEKGGLTPRPHQPNPSLILSRKADNVLEISHQNKKYLIYYTHLSGKKISLIPNFTEKKSSKTIIEENNCQSAINGGFYTKEESPLGFFMVDGKILQKESANRSLLGGFFFLDNFNKPQIDLNLSNNVVSGFQSGPLILNSLPLKIKDDKYARRSIILESEGGDLHAAIIVSQESKVSGPLLSKLAPIVFSIKQPFTVTKALNLDGGSASFFYEKGGDYIGEQTSAGSIICIK